MANSILNMFQHAAKFDNAETKAAKAFKNFLQVENGINRNFQDALQFQDSINAINALNRFNAFQKQNELERAQGKAEFEKMAANFIMNPQAGRYANPYEIAQKAMPNMTTPYGKLAAYDASVAAGGELADSLAAFDPVAAMNVRANAGKFAQFQPQIQQTADGTIGLRNSQDYARYFTPDGGGLMAIAPDKAITTFAGWGRDDVVAGRDQRYALDRATAQADLNAQAREHSAELNLRNWLRQVSAEKEQAAQKYQAAIELEKIKHATKESSDDGVAFADVIKLLDVMKDNPGMMDLSPQEQFGVALQMAQMAKGITPSQAQNNHAAMVSEAIKSVNAENMAEQEKKAAYTDWINRQRIQGAFPQTVFGHYLQPQFKATRAEELAQLDEDIKQTSAELLNTPNHHKNAGLHRAQLLLYLENRKKEVAGLSDADYYEYARRANYTNQITDKFKKTIGVSALGGLKNLVFDPK